MSPSSGVIATHFTCREGTHTCFQHIYLSLNNKSRLYVTDKVNGSCLNSSASGSDNSCSTSRVCDTPSCSQSNNIGQITSLTMPQGHKHGRTIILHTMWRIRKGGLSIIDEKWQMAGFGETGEDMERGGGKEKEGVQGHGWTETWAACRSAPALSSECEERERERSGFIFVEQGWGKRRGVMEGGGGRRQGEREFTEAGCLHQCFLILIDGAADRKCVRIAHCRLPVFIKNAEGQRLTATIPDSTRQTEKCQFGHWHIHLWPQEGFRGHGDCSACSYAPSGESVLPVVNWFPLIHPVVSLSVPS